MTCGGVQVAAQRGGEGGPAAGAMGGTHGPRAVPRLDGPRADLLAAAGASRPTDTSNCVMVLGVDFFGIEMELFLLRRVTGGKWADNMIAEAPCSMLTPVMTCGISDITDRDDDTASGI